jgi:hypothetical protein
LGEIESDTRSSSEPGLEVTGLLFSIRVIPSPHRSALPDAAA